MTLSCALRQLLPLTGLLLGLCAALAQTPASSGEARRSGNPATKEKLTARSRYYTTTEQEYQADPDLHGDGRDRALQKRASLRLVVMISGHLGDAPALGAGIIFGRGKDKLYVVTANHVVRRGSVAARDLRVILRDAPDTPVSASVTPHFDAAADVAVVEVDLRGAPRFDPCSLFMFVMTDGSTVKRGDNVATVGNPQGFAWGMSVTPEVVAAVEPERILFQSTFLSPGHSGGALLAPYNSIVGLIQSDQQPYGVARRLSSIMPKLREWNYMVELYHRSKMPARKDLNFDSTLEEAVARGDIRATEAMLSVCPDVNAMGFENRTPIHIAAMHGQAEMVSRLIKMGANVNVETNTYGLSGYTPLELAAMYGHPKIIEILLAAGADAKHAGHSGQDPTALHLAVASGQVEAVKVLARNPALLELCPTGDTPLHWAVRTKRLDIVTALIAAGASPNARGSYRRTPLHVAVSEDAIEAIPILLEAGADPNVTDSSGEKPVDTARDPVKRRAVHELLTAGKRNSRAVQPRPAEQQGRDK